MIILLLQFLPKKALLTMYALQKTSVAMHNLSQKQSLKADLHVSRKNCKFVYEHAVLSFQNMAGSPHRCNDHCIDYKFHKKYLQSIC